MINEEKELKPCTKCDNGKVMQHDLIEECRSCLFNDERSEPCDKCQGTKEILKPQFQNCYVCGGSGYLNYNNCSECGFGLGFVQCPKYEGDPESCNENCNVCKGHGSVPCSSKECPH